MKKWIVALVLLTSVGIALAAAPRKGSIHATASTDPINRDFTGSVSHLTVAPQGAAVKVLHKPHYANQDTFTVNAGDVMNWTDLDIYGFYIIRDTSTAVDVYWW